VPFINDNITSEGKVDSRWYRTQRLLHTVSATPLVLTNSSEGLVIFTGTTSGQQVRLGDATTYQVGHQYCFHNASTKTVSIRDAGNNELIVLQPAQRMWVFLQAQGDANGTWASSVIVDPATISGVPRYVLTAGYDGKADNNRYLEFVIHNNGDENPYVVAEVSYIRALSLTTKKLEPETGTVTLYKNNTAIGTISLSGTGKATVSGLSYLFNVGDEYTLAVTSGKIDRPQLFTSWEVVGS